VVVPQLVVVAEPSPLALALLLRVATPSVSVGGLKKEESKMTGGMELLLAVRFLRRWLSAWMVPSVACDVISVVTEFMVSVGLDGAFSGVTGFMATTVSKGVREAGL
jgi:hypothetical protein